MDWAISSQAPNRGRFNDYPVEGVGRKLLAVEAVDARLRAKI